MKDGLSQEIHGNMIFSVYVYKWYKYNITPLQKKLKMIFSRKNTPKVDWHSRLHSRKGSNNSLYFYGDLHRRFHILLSSEKTKNKQTKKTPENLKFDFFFNLFGWRYFTIKNLQYSAPFSLQDLYLEVCLSAN